MYKWEAFSCQIFQVSDKTMPQFLTNFKFQGKQRRFYDHFKVGLIYDYIFALYLWSYYVYEILKSFNFQSEKDKLTCWLHLSFPGIYGHVVERLNTPSFIFLLGRIIAVQASPNWPLITRLCLARDMEFVTLIMKNFGAFIPGIRGDNVNVRGLSRPCGHLMCSKRCVPVAGIHWPQVS